MKTKHAAERLHHLYHDLEQIGKLADMANREALDAVYVRARMIDIERLRLAVVDQLRRGIEPLLERQAPQLERRVTTLEEQIGAILHELRIEVAAEREPSKHGR
jgi:hypothetical protein